MHQAQRTYEYLDLTTTKVSASHSTYIKFSINMIYFNFFFFAPHAPDYVLYRWPYDGQLIATYQDKSKIEYIVVFD